MLLDRVPAMFQTFWSRGLIYAGGAGFMGALASVGAKLTLSASEALHDVCVHTFSSYGIIPEVQCDAITMTVRIMSAGLLVITNILMWLFFTKSLQFCQSSVEATITNTATNFFASILFLSMLPFFYSLPKTVLLAGVCGWLLFQERLPPLWWCGASLIVLGLVFINKGSSSSEPSPSKHKED